MIEIKNGQNVITDSIDGDSNVITGNGTMINLQAAPKERPRNKLPPSLPSIVIPMEEETGQN